MDCLVCNQRSATDKCKVCRTLLCEACGVECEHCGKMACPDHIEETDTGRMLCTVCFEERRERKSARSRKKEAAAGATEAGSGTSLDSLKEEGEPEEGEILVASAREPIPAWKLSLIIAAVGLALIIVTLVFPSWRRIHLAGSSYIPTPYFFLFIPAIAAFWAVVGWMRETSIIIRIRCAGAIAMVLASVILAFVAVQTDPARLEAIRAAEELQQRENMTPEDFERMRQERLQRFMQ